MLLFLFIDDYSRFTWLYLSNWTPYFFKFLFNFKNLLKINLLLESKFSKVMEEFTNNSFQNHFHSINIYHHVSCPYKPAQNGRAKRKHCHVTKIVLAHLFHSHISTRFWVDALSTIAYIINLLLTPLLGEKSSFEIFYGSCLNYENFHHFLLCLSLLQWLYA